VVSEGSAMISNTDVPFDGRRLLRVGTRAEQRLFSNRAQTTSKCDFAARGRGHAVVFRMPGALKRARVRIAPIRGLRGFSLVRSGRTSFWLHQDRTSADIGASSCWCPGASLFPACSRAKGSIAVEDCRRSFLFRRYAEKYQARWRVCLGRSLA